jgi:hypothetical protein
MSTVFRTTFDISPLPHRAAFGHEVVVAGSCFAQHIQQRLQQSGISTFDLPNGIVYSPAALAEAMRRALDDAPYTETDILHTPFGAKLYTHHGAVYHPESETLLHLANEGRKKLRQRLLSAHFLLITSGTSFIWQLKSNGRAVANCHKQPASLFERKMLTSAESIAWLEPVLQTCLKLNPNLQIILTLSPVRHLRDGASQNALSKAHLLVALHHLSQTLPHTFYFPAYELLLDDLRDYRFYGPDMVHPSESGVAYIWEHFARYFLGDEVREALPRLNSLYKRMQHRPLHPEVKVEHGFSAELKNLQQRYPTADFSIFIPEKQAPDARI